MAQARCPVHLPLTAASQRVAAASLTSGRAAATLDSDLEGLRAAPVALALALAGQAAALATDSTRDWPLQSLASRLQPLQQLLVHWPHSLLAAARVVAPATEATAMTFSEATGRSTRRALLQSLMMMTLRQGLVWAAAVLARQLLRQLPQLPMQPTTMKTGVCPIALI